MKPFFFICLLGFVFPICAKNNLKTKLLLAQNESTFDPFIDYGDFQDNVTEEENINFFKNGRAINLSLFGGYEAVTFNMRQIYGDAPLSLGIALSFFIDLRFAFQAHGLFPYRHYNSLTSSMDTFSRYGMDLKYYLNRQYLNKNASFFNPYFTFGPFWIEVKYELFNGSGTRSNIPIISQPTNPQTSPVNKSNDKAAVGPFRAFGAKLGLGVEIPLIKQSFIGAEVSYLYTNLPFENADLSGLNSTPISNNPNQFLIQRLQFPNRPELSGYRFLGDLLNFFILFGVNF